MAATTEFVLEGKRFELKRLTPDEACLGLEILGKALGPATVALLGGGEPDYGAILQALLMQASKLTELLKLFAPRTKYDRSSNGGMVDLKPFVGELFEGRVDLMIAYLVQAVRGEYSYFLSGNNALGQLLAQLVGSVSGSPTGPTG